MDRGPDISDLNLDDLKIEPQSIPVDVSPKEIIYALQVYFAAFIDFFLHDDIAGGSPEFHLRIWRLMTDIVMKRVAIAVPRGHAKTTLARLAAVWYFLFSDISFIVYVGNTAELAINSVKAIMDFFDNPNFIKLFGAIKFEVEKYGEGEFVFYVDTPFHGRKRCILKARGCGQALRGINMYNKRPELAIVDDLEDVDDLDNELIRNKNKRWFFGTFIKALDRKKRKVIFIGNLIDRNCLLKQCIDSSSWHHMVLGALTKEGQPLWPEMWSLNELIEDYQEYQQLGLTALWFAEMMNLIIAGENAIIRPEEILYIDQPEPFACQHGFITIDPATGTGGNATAIIVHLLLPTDGPTHVPIIADYRFGQFDESVTVEVTLSLCFQWGIRIIGIESVAYQRALATLFQIIMIQRGVTGFDVLKTYPANSSKNERIRAFAAIMKQKGYFLFRGDMHVTNQLLSYDVTKRENDDDLIDACAQGPEMMKNYLGLIMSKALAEDMRNVKVVREGEFY